MGRRSIGAGLAAPLLVLLLVGGLGGLLVATARVVDSPSTAPEGSRAGWERRAWSRDTLQAFYESLDALDARIPSTAVDLEALAAQLGGDPAVLTEFVSDSIRYEHYDGVLRGPFGVLLSRSGNSCDQALFLRDLLAVHGIRSSLRVLAADAATDAALAERAARQAPSGLPDAASGAREPLQAAVERDLERLSAAAPAFAAALRTPGRPRGIEHYCWVQAEVADGRQELDPLGVVTDRSGARTHEEVPDSLRFRFEVEVLLDSRKEGRPDTAVLTTAAFATDTLRLDPVLISVVPERADLLDSLSAGDEVDALVDRLGTLYPVVSFRDAHLVQKGFDVAGAVVEPDAEGPLPGGAGVGGRLQDMLGGGAVTPAPAPVAEDASAARTTLVGLRLKYRIRSPDGTVVEAERRLVDVEPSSSTPSERRALLASLVKQKQVLVPTFAVPRWYLARRLVDFFRQNRGALEFLARAERAPDGRPPRLLPYPFQLLFVAMAQDGAGRHLNGQGQGVLFRGSPEVLVLKQEFAVGDAGVTRTDGIDIVSTGFEALSGSGGERALRARLGIYSSYFEVLALDRPGAESLLSVLRRADEQGVPEITLAGEEDPGLAALPLSSTQRQAVMEELRAGRTVVTLARPLPAEAGPALAWWRLDPASGEVLAVLETREGGAQAATEYKLVKATLAGAAVGAASGYVMCLFTSAFRVPGVYWHGWGGRDGACVVASSCGALFGAIFGALSYGVTPGREVATNPWTGGPWEFGALDPRILWVFVPYTSAEAAAGGAAAGAIGGMPWGQFCRWGDI